MPTPPLPLPGFLHAIPRQSSSPLSSHPITAFEHSPHHSSHSIPKISTLLFLGGLDDGLLTVPYTPTLASLLPPDWRLVEPVLSSNYRQWGISTLGDDVSEVEDCVRYFNGMGGKVVCMGCSTGCQIIMHYYLSPLQQPEGGGVERQRSKIEGGIMQGSVSDREAILMMMPQEEYDELCKLAKHYVEEGRGEDVLPFRYTRESFQTTPVSAQRWLSLASPGPEHTGEDDYFSHDFGEERLDRVFGGLGRVGARVAFLLGEEDQYVLASIDKAGMVKKWERLIRDNGGVVDEMSGVLKGGSHNLKEGGLVVEDMVDKVKGFLMRC